MEKMISVPKTTIVLDKSLWEQLAKLRIDKEMNMMRHVTFSEIISDLLSSYKNNGGAKILE